MSVDGDLIFGGLSKKYSGHDTTNFGVPDFLAAFGSPVDALMYLRLFWPEFVCFEGMVFRQETLEDQEAREQVRGALRQYAGDRTKAEQAFNLVEVPSGLFSSFASESSDALDELLAQKLVELWAHRLAVAFPHEDFVVETVSAEAVGGELGVVFYTRRRDP